MRRLIKNKPVLTISQSGITTNKGRKPVSYHWSQIGSWNIENDDDNTYLAVHTGGKVKRIDIKLLEKKPEEIRALLKAYAYSAS
jgi:cell wall assembly regulator SMI1